MEQIGYRGFIQPTPTSLLFRRSYCRCRLSLVAIPCQILFNFRVVTDIAHQNHLVSYSSTCAYKLVFGIVIICFACNYMQLFGVAYLGPFGHFLHLLLDKLFKGKRDKSTVAKKVLITKLSLLSMI